MRIPLIILFFVIAASFAFSFDAQSQTRTVFSGIPSIKVSEGGTERTAEALNRSQAANLGTVISKISGKYYWATRGNKEMVSLVSGTFVTYLALDGSGYVRVIDPNVKAETPLMSPTEAKFDYVEHLLLGLRSVSYYGKMQ